MASDISQASLNLTPDEQRVYGQLFQRADSEGVGVVTGDVAVKFFEKTSLEASVLGEIWQIGDTENRGFLTPAGFSVVLRLIGHCQAGRTPSSDLAMQPGPLPRFEGISVPGQPQAAPLSQQQSGNTANRVPPLTPEKASEYAVLFEKAGARNGILTGDAARSVFERSRLPNEVLGQIWNLSDKDARGSLNAAEFVVAMHLLASFRSGNMRSVPQTLPAALYEAASRRAPSQTAFAPVGRQMTGQGPQRTQSPLARSMGSPSMSTQSTGSDWLVLPPEKAGYDRAFASIDVQGRGFITGDQAVPFFSNSGLPEESLATIWDLADIKSEGQLNRDEFAVAMYLIRQQKAGAALPAVLPPGLIPPSMRQRAMPPAVSTAPNFENPAPAAPQQKSAAEDLFGLDALSPEPAAPAAPQPSAVKTDPFASETPASPTSPKPAVSSQQPTKGPSGSFRPAFVPSSTFGRGLAAQTTGGSVQSEQSQPRGTSAQGTGADDLLGDTDPEVSKKFNAETTELANMSNQIGTLRTQMQEVQSKKTTTERDLASSSSQKKDLEDRLGQFRTQYEGEVRTVKALEQRLTTSRAETSKLTQDLAMLDGTYADLRTQHQQLQSALDADQRENADLKEKIRVLNAEIAELRPALEKMRNDARQQKGMTAINKKQLSTNEMEKDKLQAESVPLEREVHERATEPPAESSRDLASFPSPSPAASVTSQSTNPFFRKSPQQSVDNFMSPSVFRQNTGGPAGQSTFDSYFSKEENSTTDTHPTTSFNTSAEPVSSNAGTQQTPTPPPPGPSAFQTPTAAERAVSLDTPVAAVPPPPPESRQITSSALPLRAAMLSDSSPTSSVKANPPASRSGLSDIGGPAASALPQERDSESQVTIAPDEETSAIPGAFPGEADTPPKSTVIESNNNGVKETSAPDAPANFDSVFSSAASGMVPAAAAAHGEFPPIQDLQPDESESESEAGFADDFGKGKTVAPATHQAPLRPAEKDAAPPSSSTQVSPPSYEASNAADPNKTDGSEQFPKEYTGLLPPREASQGSSEPIQSPPVAGALATSPPDSHSFPVSAELRDPVATKAPAPPPTDEFDSAFDDLDEAKEADEHGQEGFSFSTGHRAREPDEDFNPTFDSPMPSKSNTMNESIQHTPTTSTGRAFEQLPASSSGNLGSSTSPFASSTTAQTPGDSVDASNGAHDWDAIFAGLDKPVDDTPLNGSAAPQRSPFALDEAGSSNRLAAPGASGGDKGRPTAPARAISTGTEHDDPILKSLTSMGYPRGQALSALEKYDYNLEKAADFLTSGK